MSTNVNRFDIICNELNSILPLEGEMAEIGVYKGTSAKIIHNKVPLKIFHLYDTFKGIVKADSSIDIHADGDFSDTSIEKVKETLGDSLNLVYHEGTFPETFTEHDKKFCFVYSDTDTYFGTKETLINFAPRMVKGGKIIFDDYDWKGCPGIKIAIKEYADPLTTIEIRLAGTQLIITFFSSILA